MHENWGNLEAGYYYSRPPLCSFYQNLFAGTSIKIHSLSLICYTSANFSVFDEL